jgi:hypothetical protein
MCKKEGESVSKITVESLILEHFKKRLKSYSYGICMNPNCDIVYFNRETDEIFFQRDLKVPVWYKNEDNPIICYCANVTLKDIINEIVVKRTSATIEDIIENTSAMQGGKCKTSNPSGKCCRPVLEDAVAYAIKLRDERDK